MMPFRNPKERSLARFKDGLIELLDEMKTPGEENDVYREMILNIALLRDEHLDLQEIRLLNKAFRELRHALRVFKAYRDVPKAAVFGSARTHVSHDDYKIALEFGKKLAQENWMLITGGASGIMEAAMVGAGAKNSFGLNILLPFEQEANEIIRGNSKLMYFKYFFTRKLMFLKESQATVLFPGGFGTFDEGFESFTLVQTGKAKPRPLVLIDAKGSDYWSSMMGLLKRNMQDHGLISPDDLSLVRHFHEPDAAVGEILNFYSNYHSSRFLKDRYLIRLRKKLTSEHLSILNRYFKNILTKGNFEVMRDVEEDDDHDPTLERLVFFFDRTSFSRLRLLIDAANRF